MRKALPVGTVIRYMDVEATVMEDEGGDNLIVSNSSGDIEEWSWIFEGTECQIVSLAVSQYLNQPTKPGWYWWCPECNEAIADKPEAWLIINCTNNDTYKGLFVGPLDAPVISK